MKPRYGQVWQAFEDEDDRFMLVCVSANADWWVAVDLSHWSKHGVGDIVQVATSALDNSESYRMVLDA